MTTRATISVPSEQQPWVPTRVQKTPIEADAAEPDGVRPEVEPEAEQEDDQDDDGDDQDPAGRSVDRRAGRGRRPRPRLRVERARRRRRRRRRPASSGSGVVGTDAAWRSRARWPARILAADGGDDGGATRPRILRRCRGIGARSLEGSGGNRCRPHRRARTPGRDQGRARPSDGSDGRRPGPSRRARSDASWRPAPARSGRRRGPRAARATVGPGRRRAPRSPSRSGGGRRPRGSARSGRRRATARAGPAADRAAGRPPGRGRRNGTTPSSSATHRSGQPPAVGRVGRSRHAGPQAAVADPDLVLAQERRAGRREPVGHGWMIVATPGGSGRGRALVGRRRVGRAVGAASVGGRARRRPWRPPRPSGRRSASASLSSSASTVSSSDETSASSWTPSSAGGVLGRGAGLAALDRGLGAHRTRPRPAGWRPGPRARGGASRGGRRRRRRERAGVGRARRLVGVLAADPRQQAAALRLDRRLRADDGGRVDLRSGRAATDPSPVRR